MFKRQLVREKCPVCKEELGVRDKAVFFMAKCDECNHYYIWQAGDIKPKAVNAKDKERKECGCQSCKALGR